MLKNFLFICSIATLGNIAMLSQSAHSQEIRYISDILYVPMRSGQGNQYRIINAAMRSGTQLQYLETSDDGDWIKVQAPDGDEGWIRSQYVMSDKPAKMQLAEALARIASLEQNNSQHSDKNEEITLQNTQLQDRNVSLSSERDNLNRELQQIKNLSRNAIKLDTDYKALLEKHQLIQTERDTLKAENENLKSDQRMDYMLYGAGLIILGILIALVVPALVPKKGHSEWK